MSYHISLKNYFCVNCNAQYIPYEEGITCPKCKTISTNIPKEYLEFISEVIISLKVNKEREGNFKPSAWFIGSFTDCIQSIIFDVFSALDKNKFKDGELFIEEYVKNLELDDNDLYLKSYINSIILKIYHRKDELDTSWWRKVLLKILP